MFAPLESVRVQVHVVAVAVHVMGLGTPWGEVIFIVAHVTHGCESSDHKMGQADKEVRRQECRVCGVVCRGIVFSFFLDQRKREREGGMGERQETGRQKGEGSGHE
jgi:hypothetical protein